MWGKLYSKKAWVGLDGFVDKIVVPVKTRKGIRDRFDRFETLKEFGELIQAASRSNLNIELYLKQEKMGGNGPLLANILANLGMRVQCVGTLGNPIHEVFKDFIQKVDAKSLGNYGETQALEFSDGKLLLGYTSPMEKITYERLIHVVDESSLITQFSESDLVCFQNWTMLLHLSDIVEKILENIWPKVIKNKERICFFDLADPMKRSTTECKHFLNLLPRFRSKGRVYLGVNRSEMCYLGKLLGQQEPHEFLNSKIYMAWIEQLKNSFKLDGLIMHCCDGAVAACENGIAFSPALKASKLTCLTGSGDHFNGGFLSGVLMNLSLEQCLQLGHNTSVLYIEKGNAPSRDQVYEFFKKKELK